MGKRENKTTLPQEELRSGKINARVIDGRTAIRNWKPFVPSGSTAVTTGY